MKTEGLVALVFIAIGSLCLIGAGACFCAASSAYAENNISRFAGEIGGGSMLTFTGAVCLVSGCFLLYDE